MFKNDSLIGICISKTNYGEIGDMARYSNMIYHQLGRSMCTVESLVASGEWRRANDFEAGAFETGFCRMGECMDLWFNNVKWYYDGKH